MKEKFISTVKRIIKREGIEDLLDYLETTDFYEAPASSMYHGNYKGGLVEHSLNVFSMLSGSSSYASSEYSLETLAIVSLFHDLCKANTYKIEMRNVKEDGVWKQVPFYKVNEEYPFGHGEKSVYLIMKHMKLTDEEALAIRWHMGGFDSAVKGGSYALSGAFNKSLLALELHLADMRATYILENK